MIFSYLSAVMRNQYIFKTERLGIRNWLEKDLIPMTALNNDPEVMEFFPHQPNKEETWHFIERMQKHYEDNGFCYFAVDILSSEKFIGFIGLLNQTYESPFTPCVDIGWRLQRSAWGKGYATEGAKACLDYGFKELALDEIYSVASVGNTKSTNVMKKIGMTKLLEFDHPKLTEHKSLESCCVYKAEAKTFVM